MDQSNKRNFTRITFQAEAIIKYRGQSLQGEIENLSLKGMLLHSTEMIPIHEPVEIQILLSGSSSDLAISLKGDVIRHDSNAMAIHFREMDLDSFIHLKNIIAYNGDRGIEVMEELHRYIERNKSRGFQDF
jgi:hypothetical protein